MADVTIYDYWRSSASYRVRIALNLKGIEFKSVPVNLLDGSHQTKEHRQRNPQGFVPALAIDGMMMTQSLAIIEYLDSRMPQPPLLPADPADAARLRAIAYAIAMDTHPICNPSVVAHHAAAFNGNAEDKAGWMRYFIDKGLSAVEALADRLRDRGTGRARAVAAFSFHVAATELVHDVARMRHEPDVQGAKVAAAQQVTLRHALVAARRALTRRCQ